jgi:outer membrane lipoprotein-sorting protein
MMLRFIVLLSVPVLMIVALARAQPTATSQPASAPATTQPIETSGAFDRQLESIDRRAWGIKDLTADFVQEKRSPLLRKPLVSRGTVKAKGALALWETTEPEPTRMTLDPQTLRLYYPNQKTIEEYPMRGQLGMMAASPLPRLEAIRQSFNLLPDDGKGLPLIEGVPHLVPVRMTPKEAQLAKYVDHVRVLLDADRGLVLAFEMVDPDGEQTLIRFSNIRTDSGISDDAMKLNPAPGTKVVRPLEGNRQRAPESQDPNR